MYTSRMKPGASRICYCPQKRSHDRLRATLLAIALAILVIASLATAIILALGPASAQDAGQAGLQPGEINLTRGTPGIAPLNPEYVDYQQSRSEKKAMMRASLSDSTYPMGLIPETVDRSYLKGAPIDFSSYSIVSPSLLYGQAWPEGMLGLPSSYDLRAMNKLTPVRDQNPAGTCWAFATMASVESFLKPAESRDFSENNLKNNAGFDLDPNNGGGNRMMSSAYLLRWGGPVNDADDPYNASGNYSPILPPVKHVQDILYIPDRANSTDNDNLKQAVMTYGAVYSSMYYYNSPSYYNSSSRSYYYSGSSGSNHAIAIVGWDDGFSRNNFSTVPPGDGAFIIRNSWGTWFGDQGYFYISYYDSRVGRSNAVFTAEPLDNYDRIYQHDWLGCVNNLGFYGETGWFAAVYRSSGKEVLSAAGFYVPQVDSGYQVRVLRNGVQVPSATQTGTISVPGYHTVGLDNPVYLNANDQFRVEVRLQTPGYDYPIAIERPISGYSSNARANASESFVSDDGTGWIDLTTMYANADVCLKAYTSDPVLVGPTIVNVSRASGSYSPADYSVSLRSQPAANVIITPSSDSNVTLSPSSLTFTPASWNVPQNFTVNVSAGATASGTSLVAHTVSSADTFYNGLAIPGVTANVNVSGTGAGIAQFSRTTYSAGEAAGNVSIAVNRTGNVTVPATVGYVVTGGSAAAGSDYTGGTGTLSFAPGATSASFNLTMVNNNTYEGNETVVVSLGSPVNVTIGANASATVTIIEDDAPPTVQFSPVVYSASESAGNLTVRAVLSGSTALAASVTCGVAGGNATQGIDYTGGSGTLSFPPGTSVASINLSIANDTAFEGNETVTLALSSPVNAILGASTTATATIVNDDPEPEVIAFNLSINEGWNLVSVPLTPTNTSITSVIPSESMSCVRIIWYYDNTDPGAPAWKYFKPGRLTNTLTDVTDGMGFWICANSSFNFTVTGTLPLDNNVTIRNGWNMVGPKGLSSQAPADVYGGYYLTWGFTDNMWYYYKPSRPTNTLTQVEPGRGYWIYQP